MLSKRWLVHPPSRLIPHTKASRRRPTYKYRCLLEYHRFLLAFYLQDLQFLALTYSQRIILSPYRLNLAQLTWLLFYSLHFVYGSHSEITFIVTQAIIANAIPIIDPNMALYVFVLFIFISRYFEIIHYLLLL